jgi:hypothetical protein
MYSFSSEAVADRLRQSRLIHFPFHAGDNSFFNLDPALLSHKSTPLDQRANKLISGSVVAVIPIFMATLA